MNIFYLDKDPALAVQYMCDKHVVKMILESAQLLCTTHWILGTNIESINIAKIYKPTHKNHPCSIWVRTCCANYNWLMRHALALLEEYSYRYKKTHASHSTIKYCVDNIPNFKNEITTMTKPALAMPDQYKCVDPVESYRNYYWFDKRINIKMTWTKRETPWWFSQYMISNSNIKHEMVY
jgi:hypothetical protein